MATHFTIKRTTTADPLFQHLVGLLDYELWHELNEDQATYDQYNKVPDIKTAILIMANELPVACGCFKPWDDSTVEIKRMFVEKSFRGSGLSKMVLQALELWANELGYSHAVLETSIHFKTAKNLYLSNGYAVIPNYPPYVGLEESVCMYKQLA